MLYLVHYSKMLTETIYGIHKKKERLKEKDLKQINIYGQKLSETQNVITPMN